MKPACSLTGHAEKDGRQLIQNRVQHVRQKECAHDGERRVSHGWAEAGDAGGRVHTPKVRVQVQDHADARDKRGGGSGGRHTGPSLWRHQSCHPWRPKRQPALTPTSSECHWSKWSMYVAVAIVAMGASSGTTVADRATWAIPSASAAAVTSPPRWVSAWGKCDDEEAIVAFLSTPANAGIFKSLFMYDLVHVANASVVYDDKAIANCTSRINALGVLVEPILRISKDGWSAIAYDAAVQKKLGDDLVAVGRRHGFHGYATDIEGPDKSARPRLLKIFGAIHRGLNNSGMRFAPFIDYSPVYDPWTDYIAVSDRLLDGMCYKSESERAFFGNCRASAHANASKRAENEHLGAAFLSGSVPGNKGGWGYNPEGAWIRVQAVIDAGSPEIGMFNLIETAPWWPPLLKQFLDNATHLPPLPPPPPPPPVPQLPGRLVSMQKCNETNIREMWWVVNITTDVGGAVTPAANTSLCLDAGANHRPAGPPLVLQPCTGAAQQRWRWNSASGQLAAVVSEPGTPNAICLDDAATGSVGHLGLASCAPSKYQHFEIDAKAGQSHISRSDGFCLELLSNTTSSFTLV